MKQNDKVLAKALKQECEFLTTILNTAGALVTVLDDQGRILRFNHACEQITGFTSDEIRGKLFWDAGLCPQEDAMQIKVNFERLQENQHQIEYEGHLVNKNGDQRLIAWSNTAFLDNQGAVKYVINTGQDITARAQAEKALRQSEERYALAVLSANDGLWDWDINRNEIYFSPRWKAMLGYGEREISRNPEEWFSRVHPEDLPRLKADIAAHFADQPLPFTSEYRIKHNNGAYRWVLSRGLAVRDKDLRPYRMVGSQTDIAQQKMTEAKLLHNAYHDALTGLPNRTLFIEYLERAIERKKENADYEFAVLFLDLDRFKVINDSLGHLVGDQLLLAVAKRLKTCLRQHDTISRFGGDEFVILLDDIQDSSEATDTADRIQSTLASPIDLKEHKVFTTVSIGIALSTTEYEWPEDILRDADTTMYRAKAQGRSQHVTFDAIMRTHAVEIWQLEAELRQAIAKQEFVLYYQPIVSLVSGQITAVEALIRWQHPQRGLLPPREFIPLAEETGLIFAIGEWALRIACAQASAWYKASHISPRMTVNVSPRQFQPSSGRRWVPELVKTILSETDLPPQNLELEITESSIGRNQESGLEALNFLREMGVQVSIDDFGINSALDLLRDFPLDTLKIDRSFIENIAKGTSDAAITTAIITMAHSLNLRVVAEGVETKKQLAFLRSQQCDEIQGYLYSQPVLPDDLTERLKSVSFWLGKVLG